MPVTAWQVQHRDDVWGVTEAGITPAALAEVVAAREGERLVTYFGKPYTLSASDPQSVYDYFNSEVDPSSERSIMRWDYEPDPDSEDVVY